MTALQPDVTFVIAAFNAERFLHRAIESALAQTGVTVEVVVVDDRSADGTLAVAERFADKGIRTVALSENRGPGGARNAGFAAARGRWIAVLDADDTVMPGRMARMIGLAETAGAEIVVDNIETVSDDGVRSGPMFRREHLAGLSHLDLPTFMEGNRIFASKFNFGYMKPAFERRFLQENALRYDETLRIGEDYAFLASALAHGGGCVIDPDVGYVYHVRKGSISRVLERRHVEAMQRADTVFEREHDLDAKARAAFMARARSLTEAASFLTLVEHLKNRDVLMAFGTAMRDPAALRHLRMPIAERIRRAAARFPSATRRTAAAPGQPGSGGKAH